MSIELKPEARQTLLLLFPGNFYRIIILFPQSEGGRMKEGYYWIQHVGVVQVAYYTNDTVDDLDSGQLN